MELLLRYSYIMILTVLAILACASAMLDVGDNGGQHGVDSEVDTHQTVLTRVGTPQHVTWNNGDQTQPCYSPDGTKIVY